MEQNNNYLAVTNNEAFFNKYLNKDNLQSSVMNYDYLIDAGIKEVFEHVRDYVHMGHRILSHPLSGSVKPNETLVKTVFVTRYPQKDGNVDEESLLLIENAIMACDKFVKRNHNYKGSKEDFELIDLGLSESALVGIRGY